ncbi:FadR/GntR family transcriptional regulator [Rubrivivax gelatinosus]|uniref:FadR/GntR family transcriptional regulator n=1 Tax=Rubrivivax gelatinosus TaxID=28068 RepID=UPI001F5B33B5|nr:FadR/GntR family transcriptional regulator [Rubrivivax gelatinosus]
MLTASHDPMPSRRRLRSLADGVVEALVDRIRSGRIPTGDRLPTESALVAEFGVSRTVVREAISKLQAGSLVETRHGIGSFVRAAGEGAAYQVRPDQLETLQDVIAVLELRIAVETEAAGLAALRRDDENISVMRKTIADFEAAVEEGGDAVGADFAFHRELARATRNPHFENLFAALGTGAIPRARLPGTVPDAEQQAYLRRVNVEHTSIVDAIAAGDADAARAAMRTHLANSRERRRRAAAAGGG